MKKQLDDVVIRTRISKGMKLLGDAWTLLIMESLLDSNKRFNELQREIGIAPGILVNRLKRLEETKMISRYSMKNNNSVEYSLTARGRGVQPVLDSLNEFIERYM